MAKAVRDPKTGRYRKRATARKNPTQKKAATRKAAPRKAAPRRAAPRRNPRRLRMPNLVGMLTEGTMTAGQVLIGKAAARSVPDLIGLPKQGNVGLAVQAGVAVAIGFVADMFMSRQAAAAILAGGLTAPLETALVAYDVPWIGRALAPTTAAMEVEAVTGYGRYPNGVSRYPQPALVAGYGGVARYPQPAEGDHVDFAAGVY